MSLERLSALAPADEEAVEEVESQLRLRLDERREHQARAAAGAELVRKMLARTPIVQRTYLLERMSRKASEAAAAAPRQALGPAPISHSRLPAMDPVAQQALNLASAVRRATRRRMHAPRSTHCRSKTVGRTR